MSQLACVFGLLDLPMLFYNKSYIKLKSSISGEETQTLPTYGRLEYMTSPSGVNDQTLPATEKILQLTGVLTACTSNVYTLSRVTLGFVLDFV